MSKYIATINIQFEYSEENVQHHLKTQNIDGSNVQDKLEVVSSLAYNDCLSKIYLTPERIKNNIEIEIQDEK